MLIRRMETAYLHVQWTSDLVAHFRLAADLFQSSLFVIFALQTLVFMQFLLVFLSFLSTTLAWEQYERSLVEPGVVVVSQRTYQ